MHIKKISAAVVILLLLVAFGVFWRSERKQVSRFPTETPATAPAQTPIERPDAPPVDRDWKAIKERRALTVLAPYNSTTYFLYRGEPLGYEYELLRTFAKEHNLALRVEVVRDQKSLYQRLNQGEGDIVAARLIPQEEDLAYVSFSRPLYRTEPALVQQLTPPDKARLTGPAKTEIKSEPPDVQSDWIDVGARLISKPSQLAGEQVHLPEKSPYRKTLIELSDNITGDIEVVEVGGAIDDEALVAKVAKGDVEYTIVAGNLGALKQAYFTNIRIRPVVGSAHSVAWAVRKNAGELRAELDRWIEQKKDGPLFGVLYKKYFADRRAYRERVVSEYLTSETGKLSRFDSLLKRYAAEISWDWRLLASQAFQESRFEPNARSWAGAAGLLQLMPRTARQFRVRNLRNPEENVRGAVHFLRWLDSFWSDKIEDQEERLRFVLASYNVGAGHVEDAQRLTAKFGGDTQKWNHVAYWLLQKSKVQYSADPVVKYGFCRGIEPVTYVDLILDRFEHYKQFVKSI